MKIINILIAYIMFIALSSNQISAETISQAKQKHPNATLLFLSSEPTTGDLNGFSIERLAITDEKIYIKIEEQEDDIIKEPKEIQGDGKSTVILFKDGSALVLSFKDKFIIYRSETKKGAMFIFDDAKNKKNQMIRVCFIIFCSCCCILGSYAAVPLKKLISDIDWNFTESQFIRKII